MTKTLNKRDLEGIYLHIIKATYDKITENIILNSEKVNTFPLLLLLLLSCVSHVRLFAIPRTVARQPPLSTGFSRQEHWSGLPRPPPGDLPDPGSEPMSPVSPALAGRIFTTEPPGKSCNITVTK